MLSFKSFFSVKPNKELPSHLLIISASAYNSFQTYRKMIRFSNTRNNIISSLFCFFFQIVLDCFRPFVFNFLILLLTRLLVLSCTSYQWLLWRVYREFTWSIAFYCTRNLKNLNLFYSKPPTAICQQTQNNGPLMLSSLQQFWHKLRTESCKSWKAPNLHTKIPLFFLLITNFEKWLK